MKALEFMTNIPANTDSTEYITQTTDIFTAIPYPLHTINITGSTPAGSDDVFVSGTFSFTDNTYKAIEYSFYFSSMGSTYVGGTLKNVYINLYADAACTDIIATKKLEDSITVGTEATSTTYIGTFSNRLNEDGSYSRMVYIGIWWNNQQQYTKVPIAQHNNNDVIV